VMHVQLATKPAEEADEPAITGMTESKSEAGPGTSAGEIAAANAPAVQKASEPASRAPVVKSALEKVGRNEPCPCGSGKKYKACHGRPGAEAL